MSMLRKEPKIILNTEADVSADWESSSIALDNLEPNFVVELIYDSGSSVNMTFKLQMSVDDSTFVDIDGSDIAISATSGTHIWNVTDMWVPYLRVAIVVTAGDIDVTSIRLVGQTRKP